METMVVRLKPYDAKRGFVLRRYAYRGILFMVGEGWRRIPKEVAEYLRTIRQKEFNPYSPAAFDVCTAEEAKTMEARERQLATERQSVVDAIAVTMPRGSGTVTTADIRGTSNDNVLDEAPEQTSAARREGRRGARTS